LERGSQNRRVTFQAREGQGRKSGKRETKSGGEGIGGKKKVTRGEVGKMDRGRSPRTGQKRGLKKVMNKKKGRTKRSKGGEVESKASIKGGGIRYNHGSKNKTRFT